MFFDFLVGCIFLAVLLGFYIWSLWGSHTRIKKAKETNKSSWGLRVLYVWLLVLFTISIVIISNYLVKQYQQISQNPETNNNSINEIPDNRLYFMSVGYSALESEAHLTECSFNEISQTSCEIQCNTLKIFDQVEPSRLKEKIQCEQTQQQINRKNGIRFAETYYIESNATCVNHITDYELTRLNIADCPNISCRLLKKDIIDKNYFSDFNHCKPSGFPFGSELIKKQDFLEFGSPKLRNYKEFERLYKKYKD